MRYKWMPVVFLFVLIFSACDTPEQATFQPQDDETSAEVAPVEEDTPSQEETSEESAPSPTETPPADTPTEEIVHWEFPGDFTITPLQKIFDCKTGTSFEAGQTYELIQVCDQWDRNFFERPLNENLTDLYPQLDIIEAEFGQDEDWYYTRIQVFFEQVENLVLDGIYAVEIDLDLDARGDILIIAAAPGIYPIDEWTSKGVQVWLDANDDVGGPTAVFVDPRYDGDGYETLLVDSGVGDDPDLAFVKTYSDQPGLIEFGFKATLLDGLEIFEWWVWAMREDLGAAKFDPVDFFPQDTLFAIDNTCGWIYGSYPRDLPNMCQTITGPKPTQQTQDGPKSCFPQTPCYGLWHGWPDCYCQVIN